MQRRALRGPLSLAVGLLAFTLVWPMASVEAAGYYLPIRGVRPLGRAGAVAVSGGGPIAMWYNPAQMAALEDTHLLLDVGVATLDSLFLRTPRQEPNGDVLVYEAVANENSPNLIPNLIATFNVIDNLTFGLGIMAPYGTLYTYPPEGAQRYTLIQNAESFTFRIGVGAAYQITDWFRIGATFQAVYFNTQIVSTASGYQGIFGRPEDEDLDIRLRIDAADPFTPSGNLGFWFRLHENLELGIAGQLGVSVSDEDAKLTVRLPTNPFFDNARLEGDTVSAGLDLPSVIRAGLRFIHDRGDVELNVTWENWAVHDVIRASPDRLALTGVFGIDEFVVGPLDIEMEWENTWAVSIGSDFEVLPDRLTVRAGFLYEQGAIPDHRVSVFQFDLDKFAPTIGLMVEVPEAHLVIDAGYTHFFMPSKNITNSEVPQVNPTFEDGAVVVGNGFYEGNIDLFGIGIEAAF